MGRGPRSDLGSERTLVLAADRPIVTIGLRDIIVVDAGDVILVAAADASQEVKVAAEAWAVAGRPGRSRVLIRDPLRPRTSYPRLTRRREDGVMAPRILVADDDRAIRDSLERALELEGYDVAHRVRRHEGAGGDRGRPPGPAGARRDDARASTG